MPTPTPLERVPSLKSLLFRHLLFKLGRAGHGPWAGMLVFGLGLGLVTGDSGEAVRSTQTGKCSVKLFLSPFAFLSPSVQVRLVPSHLYPRQF